MRRGIEFEGLEELEQKLIQKSQTDFDEVARKQAREIYTRSQRKGGTPVGDYTGGGQLRSSAKYRGDETGYTAHYGPHVEYGHLLRNGRFLPGQFYLKRNVDAQRPLYKQDLLTKIKE